MKKDEKNSRIRRGFSKSSINGQGEGKEVEEGAGIRRIKVEMGNTLEKGEKQGREAGNRDVQLDTDKEEGNVGKAGGWKDTRSSREGRVPRICKDEYLIGRYL